MISADIAVRIADWLATLQAHPALGCDPRAALADLELDRLVAEYRQARDREQRRMAGYASVTQADVTRNWCWHWLRRDGRGRTDETLETTGDGIRA